MSNQLLIRRRMMQSKKANFLTFTAEAANSSVQLTTVGTPPAVTLEYNLNGSGWLPYTVGNTISLPNVGDEVKMRGNNNSFSTSSSNYYYFVISGLVSSSGDITSLLDEECGNINLTSFCFYSLFTYCESLTQAPELPSTNLATNCYRSMFWDCKSLTKSSALPATTLSAYCYYCMFYNCKSLTQAPVLPATTLSKCCYTNMFCNCLSITSHEVAMLNNDNTIFQNNSSCASLTIHADTPPTISNDTITGLKADCKIYVPYSTDHSILNAYKTAQYWSDRAEYMYELDENGEIPS